MVYQDKQKEKTTRQNYYLLNKDKRNEQSRLAYRNNKDRHKEYYRKQKNSGYFDRKNIEQKIIMEKLKSNGCSICGYGNRRNTSEHIEILEFHHANPDDKEYQITTTNMYRKTYTDELNKCILLCPNCHKEKHYEESHN